MSVSLRSPARFGPVDIGYDGGVLEPRPWTLAQSEWAAELADGRPMLEIGCGAGQIGLAAVALSHAPLVQVDRDPAACRWAARNARRNGLSHLVEQRCGTADEVLRPDERFGLVLADPPYVPTAEVARFPEDPVLAIDGGRDGLELVRAFVTQAAAHLDPDGAVVLQVWGRRQADQAWAWLDAPGAPALRVLAVRDYAPDRSLVLLGPA